MTTDADWIALRRTALEDQLSLSMFFGRDLLTPNLRIERVTASIPLMERLRGDAVSSFGERYQYGLTPYEVGGAPDDEMMTLAGQELEAGEKLLRLCEQPARAQVFDPSPERLRQVEFQVLRMTSLGGGAAVTLVRRTTTGRFLIGERKGIPSLFQGNVLSEVEGDVVHMDGDFHGAHCGDTWFLLHSTQFEALFGFAHLYEARTRDSLREIAAGLPFDDEDQLVEGMSGYVRLRRGIEEARRGGLFRRVNATQLKGFAEDEGLPVAFKKVGRGWQIVVPTDSQGRAALVRLLRDAFVESKLSQIKYVADSKRLRD